MGRASSFDDKGPYHPLFFLAEPPGQVGHYLAPSGLSHIYFHNVFQYLDALEFHSDPNTAWLAISSSAPSLTQLLSEIKSHISELPSQPMPFLNSTIPEIYSFNSHLRRPADSKASHHFTDFTFLAVDAECFSPSPSDYTIILCSDAPDFQESETETRLKILRLPLADALDSILSVELLLQTPSEAQLAPSPGLDSDVTVVKMIPGPTLIPVEPYTNNEDQEYRIATPGEARLRKREAVMAAEAAGWVVGKGVPDGKPINVPQR